MKKTILLLLAIYFVQANVTAQNKAIDSLNQLLKNEKRDTSRVLLLNMISQLYVTHMPDSALALAQQCFSISKKIGFKKGEAISMNRMANAFNTTGNYPKALELHLASLKIAEEVGDQITMANAMSNIADDYTYQGNHHLAVSYLLKAIDIAKKLGNRDKLARFTVNLGDSYEKLDMLDSARTYANQGFDLAVEVKDNESVGNSLNNLGNIYSKMGQDVIAMANYKMSLPYYLQENNEGALGEPYLGIAKLFRKAGKNDSCLYYAKLSLDHSRKGGFVPRMMIASDFLTDYYTSIHNVDSAFAYQSATIAAKDSLFSQEKQREMQTLTFDETMRQQEIASAKATKEKERSNNIQFAIIAIAIVSFIIIFLLLSHTVIVNEKWIRFLGMMGLLLFFEFVNLFIHPYIAELTHESPLYTLLVMVIVASLLIPFHHRIEHWIKEKIVAKNKKIRLAAARRTVAQLEKEEANLNAD